ncbi:hypothetical protein [Muricoccus vinaceus]|uniref:DUF1508 domain-containing protein n=1 Tax=Muricoccus vinaceus TaxID=424704 RepID=A0ABV6ILB5_9PROT
MGRSIQVDDEVSVVVERKGYGARVWRWRLTNGTINVAVSDRAFRCAEEAYHEGKTNLLTLQANDARLGRRRVEPAFIEEAESFEFAAEAH